MSSITALAVRFVACPPISSRSNADRFCNPLHDPSMEIGMWDRKLPEVSLHHWEYSRHHAKNCNGSPASFHPVLFTGSEAKDRIRSCRSTTHWCRSSRVALSKPHLFAP